MIPNLDQPFFIRSVRKVSKLYINFTLQLIFCISHEKMPFLGDSMKYIVILALCFSSTAATITADAFKFSVLTNTDEYDISADLTLACRYEKFVISDSSEYEVTFKEVPLKITKSKNKVTFENQTQVEHEIKGYFKANKGCYAISNFVVKSKKYAVGWANQFDRPISLTIYESSKPMEYASFDANKIIDVVANKSVNFIYKAVGNQVNVKMEFGGVVYNSMSTFANASAYRKTGTNFPYPLLD